MRAPSFRRPPLSQGFEQGSRRGEALWEREGQVYLMCIPKCILDSFGIRVKYRHNVKDTCILLECNRACNIHLRYIRIHSGYMYPSGYMQDTCRIHEDTFYCIGNHPQFV
jgi:hypothetical protein